MFKVLDKDLYWSMIDDNHCTEDINKYWEFFEKSKGIRETFDKIINHLFNTDDEVINYLFTEECSRTNEAIAQTVFRDKWFKLQRAFPINNSYFMQVNEKYCKKIDAKRNNIVAFISNITSSTKLEVYLSETNFHKYCYKVDKVVPVVVFNLPEYAQEKIYEYFQSAMVKFFQKNKCLNPQIHSTKCPIVDAKKRKKIICEKAFISEEHYDKWINGEILR